MPSLHHTLQVFVVETLEDIPGLYQLAVTAHHKVYTCTRPSDVSFWSLLHSWVIKYKEENGGVVGIQVMPLLDRGVNAAVVCYEQFCNTKRFELTSAKTKGWGEGVDFRSTDLVLTALGTGTYGGPWPCHCVTPQENPPWQTPDTPVLSRAAFLAGAKPQGGNIDLWGRQSTTTCFIWYWHCNLMGTWTWTSGDWSRRKDSITKSGSSIRDPRVSLLLPPNWKFLPSQWGKSTFSLRLCHHKSSVSSCTENSCLSLLSLLLGKANWL